MRGLLRGLRPLPVGALLLLLAGLGSALAGLAMRDPLMLGFAGCMAGCGLVAAVLGATDA